MIDKLKTHLSTLVAPFLLLRDRKEIQDMVAHTLQKLVQDPETKRELVQYIIKYGHVNHEIHNTTLANEI